MDITVNQQNYQLDEPCSVKQMLSLVHAPATGIAVAINQVVVPKPDWSQRVLQHGDQVMLIKATQGG